MDMKLELVPIPVSNVDRAKAFYVEKVGFILNHDVQYLSLSKKRFTLSCETFSSISANLRHPPCFGSDSRNRV